MLMSVVLLTLSPRSAVFAALYLLCGVSDALDGFAARRLRTQSARGARLDSAADLLFAAAYAVKILPILPIPRWIGIWIAGIAAVKIVGILRMSRSARGLRVRHSLLNRLTGITVFLLPCAAQWMDVRIGEILVCALASFAAMDDFQGIP